MDKNENSSLVFKFLIFLIKRKVYIIINFLIISIIALIYVLFFAEKIYQSSITFLPPIANQGLTSILTDLNIPMSSTADVSPDQIISIYQSKAFRRRIIEKFNLYEKYELTKSKNKFVLALKRLDKRLGVDTKDIGGFGYSNIVSFAIFAEDRSKDTCYQMIEYAYHLLDSAVQNVSIDHATKSRKFTENQLLLNKQKLDSIQSVLVEFQKKNKIVDVPSQAQFALESISSLRGEILTNEIMLNDLRLDHTEEYPKIKKIISNNKVLKKKLEEIETNHDPDILLGLYRATEIGPRYFNIMRDIEVQTKIVLFLSTQLEQDKIEEAKKMSRLKIIDTPFVPEYKIKPSRAILVIIIVSIEMTLFLILLFYSFYFKNFIKYDTRFIKIKNAFLNKSE